MSKKKAPRKPVKKTEKTKKATRRVAPKVPAGATRKPVKKTEKTKKKATQRVAPKVPAGATRKKKASGKSSSSASGSSASTFVKDVARESALRRIEKEIASIEANLISQGYSARADLHVNRDGSIDAEVRVIDLAHVKVRSLLLDMEGSAHTIADTFGSVEFWRPVLKGQHDSGVLEHQPRSHRYSSRLTLNYRRIHSYWQRRGDRKVHRKGDSMIGGLFVTARTIDKHAVDRTRGGLRHRKAEAIVYRLHWNYDKVRPLIPE